MENSYTTPLAKWARFMEIVIPAYMFGKSWAVADAKTVDLFRVEFPPFLIDMAEAIKGMVGAGHDSPLGRFYASWAGGAIGLGVVVVLAVVMHLIMRDRKFVDTLRFTSVTLLPLAILNGTLSHVMKTFLNNITASTATEETLTEAAYTTPLNQSLMFFLFYLFALWFMGRRTGLTRGKRLCVVFVGVLFIGTYIYAGLLIMPWEWRILMPKLLISLGAH
ncbi:MAG: hypothetical protein WCQ99_00720 [Pseudomonadota bacterium]